MKNKYDLVLTSLAFGLIFSGCGSSGNSSTNTGGSGDSGSTGPLKIFLTSSTSPANFGGKVAADAACASDANKPDSGTYKAMLAATGRTAGGGVLAAQTDWVLKPSTSYYRADGTTLIGETTANAVFDFATTSNGIDGGAPLEAWTGIQQDWTDSTSNCTNWSATGTSLVVVGMSVSSDGYMLDIQSSRNCNSNFRFFCVQQ